MQYSQVSQKRQKQLEDLERRALKTLATLQDQLENELFLANQYRNKDQWKQFGFTMYKAGQLGYQVECLRRKYDLPKDNSIQKSIGSIEIQGTRVITSEYPMLKVG